MNPCPPNQPQACLLLSASVVERKTCRSIKLAGFSLVEVTLALGLTTFCLLAVVGLLPVGLTTLRQATEQSIESQIVQQINSELLLHPFSQLSSGYAAKTFYFDEEGKPSSIEGRTRYKVQTSLGSATYPGSANASSPLDDSMRMVQVEITRLPEVPSATPSRFNLMVVDSGN